MASNVPFRIPPPILPGNVGIALIVANDYRDTSKRSLSGTNKDALTMEKAFTFLGYRTILKFNISRDGFIAECRELASYDYSSPNGCKRVAVVFSGHGDLDDKERGVLVMQDEKTISTKELVDTFKTTANGNKTLTANLIRMFFIDACRGDLEEQRVVSRSPRGGEFIDQGSSEAGIIIAYSTIENHKAYECNNGGIWMQLLAQEMCTSREPLQTILMNVNKKLNEQCNRSQGVGKMQTAQFVSQLLNDVYFLKERPSQPTIPDALPIVQQASPNGPLIPNGDWLEPSTEQPLVELLRSQGITCQYSFIETPSREPSVRLYSCELHCDNNGMIYRFRSRQSYHNRDGAKRDVNEQAQQTPGIGHSEIFSRSAEDCDSRVEKLADYCKSKGYRSPKYATKKTSNSCYVSTVLVARNGKFDGEVADTIQEANEKAAKRALLDLGVIVDSLSLL